MLNSVHKTAEYHLGEQRRRIFVDILLFVSLAAVYTMTIIFAITAIVASIYILVELIFFILDRLGIKNLFKRYIMASENKKRKAKNSYLHNGADKLDGKLKRTMYFTKRQRNKNNKVSQDY